jgi:transcription-repair coupling factor (superfamily II helicase)
MSVRLLLKKMNVIRLDVNSDTVVLLFSPTFDVKPDKVVKWVQQNPKRYRFLSEQKMMIRIDKETALDALQEVKRILREGPLIT